MSCFISSRILGDTCLCLRTAQILIHLTSYLLPMNHISPSLSSKLPAAPSAIFTIIAPLWTFSSSSETTEELFSAFAITRHRPRVYVSPSSEKQGDSEIFACRSLPTPSWLHSTSHQSPLRFSPPQHNSFFILLADRALKFPIPVTYLLGVDFDWKDTVPLKYPTNISKRFVFYPCRVIYESATTTSWNSKTVFGADKSVDQPGCYWDFFAIFVKVMKMWERWLILR